MRCRLDHQLCWGSLDSCLYTCGGRPEGGLGVGARVGFDAYVAVFFFFFRIGIAVMVVWGPGRFWEAQLGPYVAVFVLKVVVVVLSIQGLCSEVLLGDPV